MSAYKQFPAGNAKYVAHFGADVGSLPIAPGKKLAIGMGIHSS
jgi:hypothetical protein